MLIKKSTAPAVLFRWCPWSESNRHALRRRILNPLRLPISPHGLVNGRGGRIRTYGCQDQNLVPWAAWRHPFSEIKHTPANVNGRLKTDAVSALNCMRSDEEKRSIECSSQATGVFEKRLKVKRKIKARLTTGSSIHWIMGLLPTAQEIHDGHHPADRSGQRHRHRSGDAGRPVRDGIPVS